MTLDVFLNHVKSVSDFMSEVPSCHRKADAIGTERTHYVSQKGFRDLARRIFAICQKKIYILVNSRLSVRKAAASFCFVFYFDKVSQTSDLYIGPFDISIWVFFRYGQLIVFETGLLTATSPFS